MRKRTSTHRLKKMEYDVILKLRSKAFGFYATDIQKGSRVATNRGGAYKVIGDYCERAYNHRPGQETIYHWINAAKTMSRVIPTKTTRLATADDLKEVFRPLVMDEYHLLEGTADTPLELINEQLRDLSDMITAYLKR